MQATSQTWAEAQPVAQPTMEQVLETTGPDVVVEEEVVEILDDNDDNDNEQDCVAADEESAILSMIQAYKEADAPPPAPEVPCQICATPGEASVGEQSMDTEMLTAAASLSLLYPAPVETALSSQMSQQLGPALDTLPNLEQNLHEKISPSKQADQDHLRDKSG